MPPGSVSYAFFRRRKRRRRAERLTKDSIKTARRLNSVNSSRDMPSAAASCAGMLDDIVLVAAREGGRIWPGTVDLQGRWLDEDLGARRAESAERQATARRQSGLIIILLSKRGLIPLLASKWGPLPPPPALHGT